MVWGCVRGEGYVVRLEKALWRVLRLQKRGPKRKKARKAEN